MTAASPPLRFLLFALGGWVCVRGIVLTAGWWDVADAVEQIASATGLASEPAVAAAITPSRPMPKAMPPPLPTAAVAVKPAPSRPPASRVLPAALRPGVVAAVSAAATPMAATDLAPRLSPITLAERPPTSSRWYGSAWAFVREGGGRSLASSGGLGGSQIGVRIAYRLNDDARRPVAVFGRIYVPTGETRGSEVATGVEWQPFADVPFRLVAERRQRLGALGRSALSLTAYGGVSEKKVGPAIVDAYGQAGVVGARRGDLFIDGSATLTVPVDRADQFHAGAGIWAAAQPGVERIDIGPRITARLPIKANVRLAADWRFRIAGGAAPASGPALTLATDF